MIMMARKVLEERLSLASLRQNLVKQAQPSDAVYRTLEAGTSLPTSPSSRFWAIFRLRLCTKSLSAPSARVICVLVTLRGSLDNQKVIGEVRTEGACALT